MREPHRTASPRTETAKGARRTLIRGLATTGAAVTALAFCGVLAPAPAASAAPDPVADLAQAFQNAPYGATIELAGSIVGTSADPAVGVPSGRSLTLDLNGFSLRLIGANGSAGLQVPHGTGLTIEDTAGGGVLTALGGQNSAGIGGSGVSSASGSVTVDSGTVNARGGFAGAGIGGGDGAPAGPVTINGGTVTATGGASGAGIGSGAAGAPGAGPVSINGGTVTADGSQLAAGIGGGSYGPGADVAIGSNAVVTATGGSGIAIGAGFDNTGFGGLSNAGVLKIPAGNAITVPAGQTVLNSGTIANAGTLGGAGAYRNEGVILNTGTIAAPGNVTVHNFTVALDGNGGTAPAGPTVSVYAGSFQAGQVRFPGDATRPQHSFTGWSLDASGGPAVTEMTNLGVDGPKTLTLYAQWSAAPVGPTPVAPPPAAPAPAASASATSAPAAVSLAATGSDLGGWPLAGGGAVLLGAAVITLLLVRRRWWARS